MPIRSHKSESHVIKAAEATESTLDILKSVRPAAPMAEKPVQPDANSFIEDVEQWVRKYLNLADEVLQSPAEPETDTKKSAA